jgi:hypothetical protein
MRGCIARAGQPGTYQAREAEAVAALASKGILGKDFAKAAAADTVSTPMPSPRLEATHPVRPFKRRQLVNDTGAQKDAA